MRSTCVTLYGCSFIAKTPNEMLRSLTSARPIESYSAELTCGVAGEGLLASGQPSLIPWLDLAASQG
jgi:hypothetical protein